MGSVSTAVPIRAKSLVLRKRQEMTSVSGGGEGCGGGGLGGVNGSIPHWPMRQLIRPRVSVSVGDGAALSS